MRGCLFDLSSTVCFRSSLRDVPKRDQVPPFLQRSPPPLLTAAARSGLHPAPDRGMRGAGPHLLHSSIPPSPSVCSWRTAVTVTHQCKKTFATISAISRLIGNVRSGAQRGHSLLPHGLGSFNHAPQLRMLIGLGERIACGGAGKAALRTDRETVDIDVA